MLQSIFVQNYALIDELEINFSDGFTVITGETGAGKSILLGAISLLLGHRADTAALKNKEKKCIVEGVFQISNLSLENFFQHHSLDYELRCIIRREISSEGKSRAFINDTPVNLSVLKDLGNQLVDIHSQHQNLIIGNTNFQFTVVDSYAGHDDALRQFESMFHKYKSLIADYEKSKAESEKSKADLDYFQFQYNQLSELNPTADEQQNLEAELEILQHAGEIKKHLSASTLLLSENNNSVIAQIKEIISQLNKANAHFPAAQELLNRIESVNIELKDIAHDLAKKCDNIETDPNRLNYISERLDNIYSLCQKHRVSDATELVKIKEELHEKINKISNIDHALSALEKTIEETKKNLQKAGTGISEKRKKAAAMLEKDISNLMKKLGMPNANFIVAINADHQSFNLKGIDQIDFKFTANKNIEAEDISKIASGGELSRLMLGIKYHLSGKKNLPTLILDEIDTGVSGDIADKMGELMKKLATEIQVISITHLPQIASKGASHLKVFKTEDKKKTITNIKILTTDERVTELAKMLSGSELSDAAIENAKVLLALN